MLCYFLAIRAFKRTKECEMVQIHTLMPPMKKQNALQNIQQNKTTLNAVRQ